MSVYLAFSDESGVGDPRGKFLVAGYLAPESKWPALISAWQSRVLDGPPRIPYLHMTDIRSNAWRSEHAISYNEAEGRVAEAIRVIYSTGAMSAVASVITRADLQDLFHRPHRRRKDIPVGLDEPDYACYLAFINIMLLRAYKLHPDATKVNFIVSYKEVVTKGLNNLTDVTRHWLKSERPEIAALFGDVIPASMEEELPLQAADALCWHLQCYYRGGYSRIEENRMWYLLKERDGDLHEWTTDELKHVADQIAALRNKAKT